MSVDKSWVSNPNRSSTEYKEGLNSFIKRCKEHLDNKGYVRCACARCENTHVIPFKQMKNHMNAYGICRTYTEWTHHGESLIPAVVDDVSPSKGMFGVIEDVMHKRMKKNVDLGEGSSSVRDDVKELSKEVGSELYPGCTNFSSLEFLSKLMHIKEKHKWTDNSIDKLLELLKYSLPEGNKIPPSIDVAKMTLNKGK